MKNNDSKELVPFIKKMSIAISMVWLFSVLLILIGLILAISIGVSIQKDGEKEIRKINTVGIVLLSTLCPIGLISSLIAQFYLPIVIKNKILKHNHKTYSLILPEINKLFLQPLLAIYSLPLAYNNIINSFEIISDESKEENDESSKMSIYQKQKINQEKIDKMYSNEIENNHLEKESKNEKK